MPDPKLNASSAADGPRIFGAVAVIVVDGRFLTIKRSLTVSAPGAICFPGGGIEAGEDSRTAVVRELQEELALDVRPIQQLWTSLTSWNVHLSWWQCDAENIESIQLDAREVSEFRWETPSELGQNVDLLESNHEFLRAWRRGDFQIDGLAPNICH
jgi:8-oxo-dGTP diphosphatase